MKASKFVPVAVVVGLLLTIFASPSSANDKNKYTWPPQFNNAETMNKPLLGYAFNIIDDFTQASGAIESSSFIKVSGGTLCTGLSDPLCVNEVLSGRGNWWTNVSLALCKSPNEAAPCIEALRIVENLSANKPTVRDLVLQKVLPGNTWPADPSIRLPEGSAPTLWIDPLESNKNKGYMVVVSSNMGIRKQDQSFTIGDLASFQASITPYEKISEPGTTGMSVKTVGGIRSMGFGGESYCIWGDTDECGLQSEFRDETKLQLVLHLPTMLSSWLIGRLRDPSISVEIIKESGDIREEISRVTITAEPITIPLLAAKVEIGNSSAAQRQHFNNPKNNIGVPNFPSGQRGYNYAGTASSYERAFEFFELFKNELPDRAQLMLPRWSVRSLAFTSRQFSNCRPLSRGRFQGVVATNASIYQGKPPVFDGESFSYKLAGVHRETNGDVFQGSYDLILESKFARCLYKFSAAPIQASVSITNPEGSSNIATSTFTEKDGWLKLSINGFTFSTPTIKVVLQQDTAVVAPAPTVSPTPTPVVTTKPGLKTRTISCAKGKITKKITAVKPKCPTGFKKK